jgi:hypothetical protein
MQRELGRLAHGSHEEQQGDAHEDALTGRARRHLLKHSDVIERTEGHEDEHDSQAEAEVAYPVDYEGLLAGRGRLGLVIVEADEVVGAETHRFPTEVEQQVVVGQHQQQHAEGEQAHVGEEPVVARIAAHVSLGVDEDQ